nr:MAG TPA: GGGtGRT protein [Caudoviricetes sp.]
MEINGIEFRSWRMGNNPMVGATVACAVAVAEGMNK